MKRKLKSNQGAVPILIALGFSTAILILGGMQRRISSQNAIIANDRGKQNELFYNSEIAILQAIKRDELDLMATGLTPKEFRTNMAEFFLRRTDVSKEEVERLQTELTGSVDPSLTADLIETRETEEEDLTSTEQTARKGTGVEGALENLATSDDFYNDAGGTTDDWATDWKVKILGITVDLGFIKSFISGPLGTKDPTINEPDRKRVHDNQSDNVRIIGLQMAKTWKRIMNLSEDIEDLRVGVGMTTAEQAEYNEIVGKVETGSVQLLEAEAMVAASDAYYSRAGGTEDGWIENLHQTYLGRSATEKEKYDYGAQSPDGQGRYASMPDTKISDRTPATQFYYSKNVNGTLETLCGHSENITADGTALERKSCAVKVTGPGCLITLNGTLFDNGQDVEATLTPFGPTADSAEINSTAVNVAGETITAVSGVATDGWVTGSVTLGSTTYQCAPVRYHVNTESLGCLIGLDNEDLDLGESVVRSISVTGSPYLVEIETKDDADTIIDIFTSDNSSSVNYLSGGTLAAHTPASSGTYTVTGTVHNSAGSVECTGTFSVNSTPPPACSWTKTSTTNAGVARRAHTAVWTGDTGNTATSHRMLIWGGKTGTATYTTEGKIYNPATDAWATMAAVPASLEGKVFHTAVWTGDTGNAATSYRMIVWGGTKDVAGSDVATNDGAIYDIATNTWTYIPTTGAPGIRTHHTAVWSGSEMIVFGGWDGNYVTDGGRYDPTLSGAAAWSSVLSQSFTGHWNVKGVWLGTRMFTFGGSKTGGVYPAIARRYRPAVNAWNNVNNTNAPSGRAEHSLILGGSGTLVWGGYDSTYNVLADGAQYVAASNSWTAISTTNAPVRRSQHSAIWTGSKMVVWGGCRDFNAVNCDAYLRNGGIYTPATDTWESTCKTATGFSTRRWHSGVWTGTTGNATTENRMILFGGHRVEWTNPEHTTGISHYYNDGAIMHLP